MATDTGQSPESRELALLGKVELRIALADTDSKLQTLLGTYLAPILLKCASESLAVRNKVISMCQHVNTRVKSKDVQLPVGALLQQFKEHPTNSMIRHFDVLYIQQGWSRLPAAEQIKLLPNFIDGLAETTRQNSQYGSQLCHVVLHILHRFNFPKRGTNEDRGLRAHLNLKPEDSEFLAATFAKLMLFVPSRTSEASAPHKSCPGLTEEEFLFLNVHGKPGAWNPEAEGGLNLTLTKILIGKVLSSGMLTPAERLLPALFASADSNQNIASTGEEVLKRTVPDVDLENEELVNTLFQYYNGERAAPVPVTSRIKILNLLAKSHKSFTFTSKILRLTEDGLVKNKDESAGRLRQKYHQALFAYLQAVARHGKEEELKTLSPNILGQMRSFIEDAGWPVQQEGDRTLRGAAYEIIGVFARANSQEIVSDPSQGLLSWLLKSLEGDLSSSETSSSIQDALLNLMSAYSKQVRKSASVTSFQELLLSHAGTGLVNTDLAHSARRRNVQFVVTRYANQCLPYHDGEEFPMFG
jgi:proteasome component ECM29